GGGGGGGGGGGLAREARAAAPAPRAEEVAAAPTWVFVGDSLTAGYGLAPDEGYVARLGEALGARGLRVQVRNAGVSGDTSAGVRRRLGWLLRARPAALFLCIGSNDGMRGQPIEAMKDNIRATVREAQARGARVYLLGTRLPPNYGADYERAFNAAFPALAEELKVPFMPFLLDGVAGEPSLNLGDGIHPNAEGHKLLAARLLSFLEESGALATLAPLAPAPRQEGQ
ncbi:MAG: arylesterase, partial [Deltaproteobacteria bacterium]|nr:arylesterase [Deltaproteobacteria bacterium]